MLELASFGMLISWMNDFCRDMMHAYRIGMDLENLKKRVLDLHG